MDVRECPKTSGAENEDLRSDSQDPDLQQLSPAQLIALDMLMGGAKGSTVARHLKLNPRTVYRWRHDHPAFMRVLARRREQVAEFGLDRFQTITVLALDRLEQQIRCSYSPISRTAARAVITMARIGEAVSAPFLKPHGRETQP